MLGRSPTPALNPMVYCLLEDVPSPVVAKIENYYWYGTPIALYVLLIFGLWEKMSEVALKDPRYRLRRIVKV